eukprot:286002_1
MLFLLVWSLMVVFCYASGKRSARDRQQLQDAPFQTLELVGLENTFDDLQNTLHNATERQKEKQNAQSMETTRQEHELKQWRDELRLLSDQQSKLQHQQKHLDSIMYDPVLNQQTWSTKNAVEYINNLRRFFDKCFNGSVFIHHDAKRGKGSHQMVRCRNKQSGSKSTVISTSMNPYHFKQYLDELVQLYHLDDMVEQSRQQSKNLTETLKVLEENRVDMLKELGCIQQRNTQSIIQSEKEIQQVWVKVKKVKAQIEKQVVAARTDMKQRWSVNQQEQDTDARFATLVIRILRTFGGDSRLPVKNTMIGKLHSDIVGLLREKYHFIALLIHRITNDFQALHNAVAKNGGIWGATSPIVEYCCPAKLVKETMPALLAEIQEAQAMDKLEMKTYVGMLRLYAEMNKERNAISARYNYVYKQASQSYQSGQELPNPTDLTAMRDCLEKKHVTLLQKARNITKLHRLRVSGEMY